ncbi:MAG: DUF389 domain-containing protein [Pseudomonadota bacterium]|nr:DUF389 domain-containing protein [Pseudomonadota bacterium]
MSGKPQTSDELMRSAPCQAFVPLYGAKAPSQVDKILFVATRGANTRAALRLVHRLQQRRGARVTVGIVDDETGAKAGRAGESGLRALLHDMALDEEGFEVEVVVDRLKPRGIIELFDDQDPVVTGWDAAATFAMARPNISGAIASVAIATALVPPVCAVGISLAHTEWLNALGAAMLFFTNLLAIIVISSFTFSFLGVTASRALEGHRRRAKLGQVSLVVLLLVIAGPLSTALVAQLEQGKNVPLAHPVTTAVSRALYERVAQDEGVEIMFMGRPRAQRRVMIHIASRDELPPSYANELRKIVRDEMDDPELTVNVVAVRGLWRSDSDSPGEASR